MEGRPAARDRGRSLPQKNLRYYRRKTWGTPRHDRAFWPKKRKNFFRVALRHAPVFGPCAPRYARFWARRAFPGPAQEAPGNGPAGSQAGQKRRPLPRCLVAAVPPCGCAFRRAGGARCPGRLPCPGDVRAGILQGMGGRTPETGRQELQESASTRRGQLAAYSCRPGPPPRETAHRGP